MSVGGSVMRVRMECVRVRECDESVGENVCVCVCVSVDGSLGVSGTGKTGVGWDESLGGSVVVCACFNPSRACGEECVCA
jgi:hypothetical protein